MDTKTRKPQKKTPKQAVARVQTLLKGIDNSVLAIEKHKAIVNSAVKEMKSLMGGIGNAATAAPAKKPAPAKKLTPAKKPEAKKAASAKKPEPAKKPETKAAVKKPETKAAVKKPETKAAVSAKAEKKPPVEGRPLLKEAVRQIIAASGPMTAAGIWKQATGKWGYWSRQSLYNVLENEKAFAKKDGKFVLAINSVDDAEAEKFIKQVEGNQAVSSVQ